MYTQLAYLLILSLPFSRLRIMVETSLGDHILFLYFIINYIYFFEMLHLNRKRYFKTFILGSFLFDE